MIDKKILKYTVQDHFNKATLPVQKMFLLPDPKILKLDEVEKYARSNYIGYKPINIKSPFVEMHFKKRTNKVEIHLRPVDYSDSKLDIRKVPDSHAWKLNVIVSIQNKDEVDAAVDLIKKSYDHVLQY